MRLQYLTFVVGEGEYTLGCSSVVVVLVEKEFVAVFDWRDDQQVEVVKSGLLLGFPVIIVKVIFNPHESLVNHFRYNRLL